MGNLLICCQFSHILFLSFLLFLSLQATSRSSPELPREYYPGYWVTFIHVYGVLVLEEPDYVPPVHTVVSAGYILEYRTPGLFPLLANLLCYSINLHCDFFSPVKHTVYLLPTQVESIIVRKRFVTYLWHLICYMLQVRRLLSD